MEKRIETVIKEIGSVCKDANLSDNPVNLIHTLIAYLRTKKIKTEEDYAINAIVAVLIHDSLHLIKEELIKLTIDEIAIFCKALMIYEEECCEKNDLPVEVIEEIKKIEEHNSLDDNK